MLTSPCFSALTAPAAAAKRQVPQGWLGVVVDGPLIDPAFAGGRAEWDQMAGSGAESVRTAVYWSQIQPTGPADAELRRARTRSFLAAARRGLDVLPVCRARPDWAAMNPFDPASPPRDPADFARLLTALVARYGPNGSLWARAPRGAAPADPGVADLERAQPHPLLERRALGAVLRGAAQGRPQGAQGRRPAVEDRARRAAERELGGARRDL